VTWRQFRTETDFLAHSKRIRLAGHDEKHARDAAREFGTRPALRVATELRSRRISVKKRDTRSLGAAGGAKSQPAIATPARSSKNRIRVGATEPGGALTEKIPPTVLPQRTHYPLAKHPERRVAQ
jgi:hypothetical protein